MQDELSGIKVWDILVRIFHWSLALSFFIAYVAEDFFFSLHVYASYLIILLLFVRIIWGLIGTRYARFSDFIYPLKTIKAFLKDSFLFKAQRYIGHNPAGGVMVILLMLSLVITITTGMAVYGAEDQSGPMASWFSQTSKFWADVFEELHEFFANVTLLLVFIHIAGVIFESLLHKENLVKSMITGFKKRQ